MQINTLKQLISQKLEYRIEQNVFHFNLNLEVYIVLSNSKLDQFFHSTKMYNQTIFQVVYQFALRYCKDLDQLNKVNFLFNDKILSVPGKSYQYFSEPPIHNSAVTLVVCSPLKW